LPVSASARRCRIHTFTRPVLLIMIWRADVAVDDAVLVAEVQA